MKWSTWTSPVVFLVFLLTLTACGGGGGGGMIDAPPAPPFTVSGLNLAIKTLTGFFSDTFGAGVAVNESGQSVGVADNGTTLQAVRWDASAAAPTPVALVSLTEGMGIAQLMPSTITMSWSESLPTESGRSRCSGRLEALWQAPCP